MGYWRRTEGALEGHGTESARRMMADEGDMEQREYGSTAPLAGVRRSAPPSPKLAWDVVIWARYRRSTVGMGRGSTVAEESKDSQLP